MKKNEYPLIIMCTVCKKNIRCSMPETSVKSTKEKIMMFNLFKDNFICAECQGLL